MTLYRNYRGLYGEPVRVPERTIVSPSPIHSREPFPFARLAARLGRDRDQFAQLVRFTPLIEDVERSKSKPLRRLVETVGA